MGTYSFYKEASEAYKNEKKKPILNEDDYISSKKKKKKKKNKKSKHKHEYIPAIYNMSYKTNLGNIKYHQTFGFHCSKCGRVEDMYFMWSIPNERFDRFKKEYPNCIEITLPENWDYFKDKYVPI